MTTGRSDMPASFAREPGGTAATPPPPRTWPTHDVLQAISCFPLIPHMGLLSPQRWARRRAPECSLLLLEPHRTPEHRPRELDPLEPGALHHVANLVGRKPLLQARPEAVQRVGPHRVQAAAAISGQRH